MAPATGSPLLRADAKAKLETAAAAAGLSLQQLVDLVVDSGALTLPPAQTPAPLVTLRDLGKRMWAEMQEVLHPDRARWFQELLQPQQIALVVRLREEGYRSEIIAQDLGISPFDVARVYNQHADNLGAQVVSVRLNTLAGQIALAAERAQQGLMEKDDWKGYWAVAKDMVGLLQSLGIVDQAVRRVEVTHKFDDQKKAEIERMLDIERKKAKRLEEIKQADATVLDEPPQIELEGENET